MRKHPQFNLIQPGVYLDILSDQGYMYGRSVRERGNRTNRFCECDIVGLRSTFNIVMRDVNMTTIDNMHDAM